MRNIPEKLARALDELLRTVNDPDSEDSDIVREALHVLVSSGRRPDVWEKKPGAGE